MTRLRPTLGAALLVVGAGAVLAPPAQAHGPAITVTASPAGVPEGQALRTTTGHATHDGELDADMQSVILRWRTTVDHGGRDCSRPADQGWERNPSNTTRIDFSQDATFDCNGRYELDVIAVGDSSTIHSGSQETKQTIKDVVLKVAPAVPTGVTATSSQRRVEVTWAANGEPDLLGYLVYRNGSFHDSSTTNSYVDTDFPSAGGTFTYKVSAVRLGPSQNPDDEADFVESGQSGAGSATVPKTTSTSSGGSGDDGDGGSGGGPSKKPTVKLAPTPSSGGSSARADLSGFARLKQQADEEARLRSTTTDPGYSDELPYGEGGGRNPDGSLASGGDRSTFEEVVDRKAVMVPIAFGLLLFVGALQMRYLARRARDIV